MGRVEPDRFGPEVLVRFYGSNGLVLGPNNKESVYKVRFCVLELRIEPERTSNFFLKKNI